MSDIKIAGADKLLKKLDGMLDKQGLEAALAKACAIVEADAKKKAPKGEGDLRRSITSKVEGTEGIVYTPLEYAPYVEYGTGLFAESGGRQDVPWFYIDDEGKGHITSGMKPQPYMRPALNENRQKILRIIGEALKNNG